MEVAKFVIEIVFILVGLYMILFKNYFAEKGKNIATKEDIGEITAKIEMVKNNISAISSKEQDWFIESKLALINFFDNYILWTEHSIKRIDIVINHSYQPDKIRKTIEDLSFQHSQVIKYLWRLMLYEKDEKFLSEIKIVYFSSHKLHNLTDEFLIEIESIAMKLDKCVELASKGSSLQGEISKLATVRNKAIDTFIEKRKEIEKECSRSTNILLGLIRKKLSEKYPDTNSLTVK